MGEPYNLLFLCTGNSARSIMAEALANHWSRGRFCGFSAGSHPKADVHPLALEILKRNHCRPRLSAARAGMSSRGRTPRTCISCSPSAIVLRKRCARSGLVNQ